MTTPLTFVRPDSPEMAGLLARHTRFWRREPDSFLYSIYQHTPSLPVALPQSDGSTLHRAERLTPDMVNAERILDQFAAWDLTAPDADARLAGQYLAHPGRGDIPPSTSPFGKIPWLEAMLGCPIKMTEGQIWAERYAGDPQEVIDRGLNFEHNPWYQLYLEFLRLAPPRLGKHFIVSAATLIRGVSDLVAAIMGVQEACVGWIDQPAFMARLLRVCTDAVLTVWAGGYKTLAPFQDGYLDGWGVWGPAPAVATQADHSTLISARMYQRHILPYDLEVIRCCPLSIFHLHNCGLHVAPVLLEVEELSVIEVFLDPYPEGERKLWEVEMLQRIQQHKPLIIDANLPSVAEGEWLLSQLDRRGLLFDARLEPAMSATLPADMPARRRWILNG